jgi:8-oxo-dGTP diphosphatase
VVAGILRRAGRVLLARRSATRRWYPDAWDLSGGHVRDGEGPRAALVRELREELGVEVTVPARPAAQVQGETFRMDIWMIDTWVGEPSNTAPQEHDALAWVGVEQARGLKLADPRLLLLVDQALAQP